jgi:hypothetical protein
VRVEAAEALITLVRRPLPSALGEAKRLSDERHFALLRALRGTMRADSDPGRRNLFASLKRRSLVARLVTRLYAILGTSWASTMLVSMYGLKSFLSLRVRGNRRPLLMTVAVHANARRQVDRVAGWFPGGTADVRSSVSTLLTPVGVERFVLLLRSPGTLARALRVIHRINSRRDFLVSCRSASTLACYSVARHELTRWRPGAVLVSSDNNPEETAFTAASRSLDVPSTFISHAYPTAQSVAVDFDLSLLEGEAAAASRRLLGSMRGEVFFVGLEGDSRPMDATCFETPNAVIGIFPPKVADRDALRRVIDDCRSRFAPRAILIRWHPSTLEPLRLRALVTDGRGVTETPTSATATEIALQCDWAISDSNSNVHLELLKVGVPTIAVEGLGVHAPGRRDQYGFVSGEIIPPAVTSIRELSIPDVVGFYSGMWPDRFSRFDAAYLRDRAAIEAAARSVIERVANQAPATDRPRDG